MTPGPLGTWRVVDAIFQLETRRWLNRAAALMAMGRGKSEQRVKPGRQRSAVAPRQSVSWHVFQGVIAIIFMFSVFMQAGMFMRNLSSSLDNAGPDWRIGISSWVYDWLKRSEELASLRESLSTIHRSTSAETEPAGTASHAQPAGGVDIESEMDHEAFSKHFRNGGDKEQIRRQLVDQYRRYGVKGFYPLPNRDVRFVPAANELFGARLNWAMLAFSVVLWLLLLMALFQGVGGFGLAAAGAWDTEWFFLMPARAKDIFLAQVIHRAVLNPTAWVILSPLLLALFLALGFGAWSVLMSVASVIYLSLVLSSAHLVLATWMHKRLSPGRLKNLQALFMVLGVVVLFVAMGTALSEPLCGKLAAFVRGWPSWLAYLPLPAVGAAYGADGWAPWAAMALIAAGSVMAATKAAGRLVRDGLLASGEQSSSRRQAGRGPVAAGSMGIAGRELRLLVRDRTLLATTFIIPPLVVGMQLYLQPSLAVSFRGDFHRVAAMAFGIGGYLLMASMQHLLASEGKALWLAYSLPVPLERVMRRKVVTWSGLTVAITAAMLLVGAWQTTSGMGEVVLLSVLAILGVVVFAWIAGGISLMCTEPHETLDRWRQGVGSAYLVMLLLGLYAAALFTGSGWNQISSLALYALVAVAVWQMAGERMPYLLDRTAGPPPRISAADAMIATFFFFMLQGMLTMLLAAAKVDMPAAITVAYAISGAVVAAASLVIFRVRKAPAILACVGLGRSSVGKHARGVALGMAAGLAAAGVAAGYLWLVARVGPLQELLRQSPQVFAPGSRDWGLVALLAVVAAPLVEEYLFRGLLLNSLRRMIGVTWAVAASAAIFAMVHPPVSILPVLVLGLAAGTCMARTSLLTSAIATHMTYNAVVMLLGRI